MDVDVMEIQHFCGKCGTQLEKVKGTKATYKCPKCGATVSMKWKKTIGSEAIGLQTT
jgi:DNA-directed RNA polymerase subunit RPC12/RpoP